MDFNIIDTQQFLQQSHLQRFLNACINKSSIFQGTFKVQFKYMSFGPTDNAQNHVWLQI